MNKQEVNLILNNYSGKVEPIILELLCSRIEKKNHPLIKYQILSGGKRLRPAMILACCQMMGGKIKEALYAAACIEILHNYTLIIDDIIDNSSLRRGNPTVWKKFGRPMAECVAVAYVASIFQENDKRIHEIFSSLLKTIMAEGEILDILFEQTGREQDPYIPQHRYHQITRQKITQMTREKTAVLFQACCEIAGLCTNSSKKELDYLKDYGLNFGLAFQISDDILDIFGKEKEFGKQIGKDIEEGKGGNWVIFFALKEFSDEQEKEFLTILRKKRKNKKDINKAIKLIEKTKAKEKAIKYGENFVKKAKESLEKLPKNKHNDFLLFLVDSLMSRKR